MNEFDIPIFKKSYDLYKRFYEYRRLIPKKDRFTTYERAERTILDIIQGIFKASAQPRKEKNGYARCRQRKIKPSACLCASHERR